MRDAIKGASVLEIVLLILLLGLLALAVWTTLGGGPAKMAPQLQKIWNRG